MIKRIIFDIDYTLLIPNYDFEKAFFSSALPNSGICDNVHEILKDYEQTYEKYTEVDLIKHLNNYSNYTIDDEFLAKWFEFNVDLRPQDVSAVRSILAYLKNKNYQLVALSNWFTDVQLRKLEIVGLRKYFQEIYGGDLFLKPNMESYLGAIGNCSVDECLMIGDSLDNDVIGAVNAGLKAIHYTRGRNLRHQYPKVKKLNDLKKIL